MTNHPKILGDCYKKFNLAHTSKSQNTIPDDIRFRNYIVLTPKEKANLPSNCSFTGGTIAHEIIQKILCKNLTYEQALESVQEKIINYNELKFEILNEKPKIVIALKSKKNFSKAENLLVKDLIKEVLP